ncbi:MAG: hypothetical protein IJP59_09120 [Muribaculaceae bacterium]|nr:hypothetical protein [Muribaculaceae bacterium]
MAEFQTTPLPSENTQEALKKEEKKESKTVRFFVSLVWFILSIAVDVVAITTEALVVGAAIEFVFFIITFCVPYLRKKGSLTRWVGYLALLQGLWLVYLMTQAG